MNPYMENTLHLQKRATNIYHPGASKSFRGGADWQPPREAVAGPGLLDPVGNGQKSCSQMTSGSSVFTIFVAEVGVWSMLSHLCSSSGQVPGSLPPGRRDRMMADHCPMSPCCPLLRGSEPAYGSEMEPQGEATGRATGQNRGPRSLLKGPDENQLLGPFSFSAFSSLELWD